MHVLILNVSSAKEVLAAPKDTGRMTSCVVVEHNLQLSMCLRIRLQFKNNGQCAL